MSDETTPAPRIRNGGALWCDEHQRWECVKNRKQARGGGRCHMPAITGLPRCRLHAGRHRRTRRGPGRGHGRLVRHLRADRRRPRPGRHRHAQHGRLQGQLLRVAAGRASTRSARRPRRAGRRRGRPPTRQGRTPSRRGSRLIGHTYSADKEHGIFASGEAIRGLVLLEGQERDRVVKYAKAAHDMGIAERHIRVAEQQAEQLAGAIRQILDGLNLSAEQQQVVPQLVPSVLRAIASGNPAA
ncbi:hypothetical protein [Actinomadura madurae]|uniref:hypothetical protein n=1 Tax=Actinomadura madurae TaxID=1993 RepID=UPI0020D25A30|nr:hypothetical protein [Actinomadura madurae]MCQ0012041.1 hypothetical protein [Actinomadura madurae]